MPSWRLQMWRSCSVEMRTAAAVVVANARSLAG